MEPRKTRTGVVFSNDLANRYGQAITVVPTQRYTAERAGRAFMVDLRRPRSTIAAPRVANASTIMRYDRRRVVKRAGRIARAAQRALDAALALHLDLPFGETAAANPEN